MISIIVAMAKNRVIGKNNTLPWYIPEDLKRTKKITLGHPIIMGRKNHEAISAYHNVEHKVLPKRTNIIVTSDKNYKVENAVVVNSIKEAINKAKKAPGAEEIFIFGGASIYEQTLHLTNRIYLTLIDKNIDGDTFFPQINESEWIVKSIEKTPTVLNHQKLLVYFKILERKSTNQN